jgi:pimeloyl-ACP methyl ester carboxylesterase
MKNLLALGALLLTLWAVPIAASAAGAATAPTRYAEIDGDRIAYRSIGSGRPILLANRMRGTLDTWDPLFLDHLAAKHRVVIFDYPGIGYSSGTQPADIGRAAAVADALATKLQLDRFVIAGWSWGGLVAQALVTDRPNRATHAVLVATAPPGRQERPIQRVFLDRAFNPVNDLADEEILFFEPASPLSLAAARQSRERIRVRAGVDERIPSTPAQIERYIGAAKGFHEDRPARRDALMRTATPMLVISGSNDPSTAAENWYPLVGRMQRTQLVVFAESGHGPQHQYPAQSARLIADFVAGVQ